MTAIAFVKPPPSGRIYRTERSVRFGDVRPDGTVRFDALARYLQDIAFDDTADAGVGDLGAWIMRRTACVVIRPPVLGEGLSLTTWASGAGRRWAERRLSIQGAHGGRVELVSLWVFLDPATLRPALVPASFDAVYAPATQGRRVTSRLLHDAGPPAEAAIERRPWVLRATDFDPFRHVNNAAAWAMLEEVLAERPPGAAVMQAEIEFRRPIETSPLAMTVTPQGEGFSLWAQAIGPDQQPERDTLLTAVVHSYVP